MEYKEYWWPDSVRCSAGILVTILRITVAKDNKTRDLLPVRYPELKLDDVWVRIQQVSVRLIGRTIVLIIYSNFMTPALSLSVCPTGCMSVCLSVCLPLSVCLSVCPSVCLYVCLSVCLSISYCFSMGGSWFWSLLFFFIYLSIYLSNYPHPSIPLHIQAVFNLSQLPIDLLWLVSWSQAYFSISFPSFRDIWWDHSASIHQLILTAYNNSHMSNHVQGFMSKCQFTAKRQTADLLWLASIKAIGYSSNTID